MWLDGYSLGQRCSIASYLVLGIFYTSYGGDVLMWLFQHHFFTHFNFDSHTCYGYFQLLCILSMVEFDLTFFYFITLICKVFWNFFQECNVICLFQDWTIVNFFIKGV